MSSPRFMEEDMLENMDQKRFKMTIPIDEEKLDLINILPDEIILDIFKFLPLETILLCQAVCKRWNKLANDPTLWKRIVLIYSGKPGQSEQSEKNLKIINTHSQYIYCLKIQYVYSYSVIKYVIEKCKNLLSLELVMCRVGKELADDILHWPNLRKISLKNSILVLNSIDICIQFDVFKELNYLALSDFGLNPKNCNTLLQCTNLTHILIEKVKNINLDFIQTLALTMQRQLETLHIYGGASVNDTVLHILSECPHLKDLAIVRCEFLTDAGLTKLISLKKILHLQLWNNTNFSESALLKTLGSSALIKLQSLSLSRINNITPTIVDLLSENYKNLKFLALYQCPRIIHTDYERQLKSKFRNIDVALF